MMDMFETVSDRLKTLEKRVEFLMAEKSRQNADDELKPPYGS